MIVIFEDVIYVNDYCEDEDEFYLQVVLRDIEDYPEVWPDDIEITKRNALSLIKEAKGIIRDINYVDLVRL